MGDIAHLFVAAREDGIVFYFAFRLLYIYCLTSCPGYFITIIIKTFDNPPPIITGSIYYASIVFFYSAWLTTKWAGDHGFLH